MASATDDTQERASQSPAERQRTATSKPAAPTPPKCSASTVICSRLNLPRRTKIICSHGQATVVQRYGSVSTRICHRNSGASLEDLTLMTYLQTVCKVSLVKKAVATAPCAQLAVLTHAHVRLNESDIAAFTACSATHGLPSVFTRISRPEKSLRSSGRTEGAVLKFAKPPFESGFSVRQSISPEKRPDEKLVYFLISRLASEYPAAASAEGENDV